MNKLSLDFSKLVEHYQKLEQEQAVTFPVICKEWLDEKLRHKEIAPSIHTKYMTDCNRFFTTDHTRVSF